MRKLFILVIGLVVLTSCNSNSSNKIYPSETIEIETRTHDIGKLKKITLEGHDYWIGETPVYGGSSITLTHSASCEKCFPMPDSIK